MNLLIKDETKLMTSKGLIILSKGQIINVTEDKAMILIEKGKALSLTSMLERLSDSERELFEERAAIIEYDGGLEKERAEIEVIKQIIRERVIPGKCDKCIRVEGCMLTRGQRQLCQGPFDKDLDSSNE